MRLRLLFSIALTLFLAMGYAQIETIGLIGSATPGGWDADTNMVQVDDSTWTLTITLTDGAAKFRANDNWDVNWGSLDFPSGIGTQGGADIPVYAGTYDITFNSNSGAYYFDIDSDISLIGDAANGWNDGDDIEMYPDSVETAFFVEADLVVGKVKFRKDKMWDVAWGSADFPSGIATTDGGDIQVNKAGTYYITFDTLSGAFNFAEVVTYSSISVIGSATPGGWDADTDLSQDANDPNLWKANVDITEGALKFRANGDWEIDWGGGEFPTDTAVLKGSDIMVSADQAGTYLVRFNTETLIYEFLPIVYYETIGLVGSASPLESWDEDVDMTVDAEDPALWHLRAVLLDGEAKFRADNAWDISWGGGEFPSGIATSDNGPNIPVTAGEYIIDFNTTTGVYNFEAIVVYDTIGMVGGSTPTGSWDEDFFLDKDAEDEFLFTLAEIELTDKVADDEGVKIRADGAWAINWGADSWPSGIGTQDGPNIPTVAGTWRVTFRTDDGSYSFDTPSDVLESVLKTTKFYPNPAQRILNIELDVENIKGDVNIEIFSMTGQRVLAAKKNASSQIQLDLGNLIPGNYVVRMHNESFFLSKPLSVVK